MKSKPDVNSFIQGGAAQEADRQTFNENEVVYISRENIIPDPGQDRDDWDDPATMTHVKKLADSMNIELPDGKKYGVRDPITVYPADDNGKHVINKGESRWRAAGQAGIDKLPCLIKKRATVENRLDHVTENALKKGLTLWQRARSIQRDKEEFGFDTKQIMIAHGIGSKSQLSKIMAVLTLEESAQELVRRDLVGDVNLIYDLKKLDEKQIEKLKKKIDKGDSVPQAIKALVPKPKKDKPEPKAGVSESETPGQVDSKGSYLALGLDEGKAKALAVLLDISPALDPGQLKGLIDERLSALVTEGA
jgi:ParB family chromosome partitioning protein